MTDGDERKYVLDYTHVDLHYVEDQRKNLVNKFNLLKQELKVTLDQLLSEQIPGNIVKALGGRGKRKEKISSKEVIFIKADESSSILIRKTTSDSESECETQEPLPPLPKLIGATPAGTLDSLIYLSGLTLNMADLTLDTSVPKKTRPTSVKVSPGYVIKRKTKNKSPAVFESCTNKKADSSTKQLLLTLMEECSTCGSTNHLTKEHLEHAAAKKTLINLKAQSPLNPTPKRAPMIPKPFKECKYCGFNDHHYDNYEYYPGCEETQKGYGLVNCNGITFTRVAYVNGLKHNLIRISQLYDANFKVLFTKTQGTIFNQNDKVVIITPRRRDVYVIDMSSFNKESNAYFFANASPRVNWLWHKQLKMENLNEVRVKELRSDNGTEFRNHKLEELCDEKGISQNFSSPCTPEKNGVAERRNKTLIEATRTMLNSAKLPKQFWGGLGRSPNISYFHVFGCPVHIHNHRDHLGKFDEKADDGFFLGYSLVAKAFRVFNVRRQEMEETIHFTFSKDDDEISQVNTEGDAINFNKNRFFPRDEFLEPRSKDSVSPEEPPEFTNADDYPAFSEHDHFESGDNLEPAEIQDNVIIEPISDTQSSPTTISPSPESILQTPVPQDR
ncbi:retrovirus-related pol polyprotein from transposon TNT 1-94 [Tanacetum coccineum]